MLTGDQIAGARDLVGLRTAEALAEAAGIGVAIIMSAEEALNAIHDMDLHDMGKIIRAGKAWGAVHHRAGSLACQRGGHSLGRRAH